MTKKKIGIWDVEAIALFGVALPIVTLIAESLMHMCGSVYVDPIPSLWHISAIAFVAVANGVAWKHAMKGNVTPRWLPFMIGASIGVSVFYALVFAPMVPVGIVLLAFVGFGLLPLSPFLAFLSAVRLAFITRRMRKETRQTMKGLPLGILAGILFLIAAELPNLITGFALRQASSENVQTSRAGVRLLRTFGSEQSVLRSCYQHMASVSDISSLVFATWHKEGSFYLWHEDQKPVTVEGARQIYYRAYGRPFNSVTRPHFSAGIRSSDYDVDEQVYWNDDAELAGEDVGGRTAGVRLAQSSLAASINPDTATSYSEWTMVFNNESYAQQEARMQIELPRGGVVTRATLWINGEEKEAAFGERSLVRHAYQAVVASKRDPLLITAVGPDKIMLQCFPIPPKTTKPGEMKVRIGFTAPCAVPTIGEADLTLPRIAEHGFPIKCKHQIRIESPVTLVSSLQNMKDESDALTKRLAAEVDDATLKDMPVTVKAQRNAALASYWTATPLSAGKKFVVAELKRGQRRKPTHLYVVIDGSAAMSKYMPQVAGALANLPADVPTEISFASDEISSLVDPKSTTNTSTALRELLHAPCVGGPDNSKPLAAAWEKARKNDNSAVLWIHGPQPVLFGTEANADNGVRTAKDPTLYDVEAFPGPNRLLEKLYPALKVVEVPRTGSLKPDLERFLSALCGSGDPDYVVARNVTTETPQFGGAEIKIPAISTQLVSLWAYGETLNLLRNSKASDAVKLASRHRLVTPVTGAVVLETAADYKKNGIDPNNPDNNDPSKASTPVFQIGAAPEPEEYALMMVALLAVAWQIWRKRSLKQRAA